MANQSKTLRLMNRDGSFNIARKGKRFFNTKDFYHSMLTTSWKMFFLFVGCAYFLMNLMFALIYLACGKNALDGFSGTSISNRFVESFFFSVQTLATIGYGKLTPNGILPNIIVSIEALVGLLGVAFITGLMFAKFSRPTAKVLFSEFAVINVHDGVRSFILRVVNQRMNQIVDAKVTVTLSRTEKTSEGEVYRNFYTLDLERSRSPIFALSWTIVHPITESSPLYNISVADLENEDAEFMVSLTGIDDTFSQTIHTRCSYKPSEIFENKRYVDIFGRTDEGLITLDLDKLHDIIEV